MRDPIVVDFEGFANTRPVLAGVLVDGRCTQTAFTDVEPGIEVAARARRLECMEFASFCAELVGRARREGRGIAGFSSHERDWIASGLGGCWPADVEYVDAKRCAKAWRSRRHPEAAERVHVDRTRMRQAEEWCRGHGNRLVDFVRLAGLDLPDDYGDQRVTAALRRVLQQSSRRARFGGYPQGVQDAWSAVLRHNRCDCRWARMFVRWGGSRPHGAGSGRRSSERGTAA